MKSTYGTMYYVSDMSNAVKYYKNKLGLSPTYESADWTEFSVGGHNLCLHAKDPKETYTPNGILIFNTEHIKEKFQTMKNDGLNVFGLHEINPEAWSFHLKDDDNNETSFYGKP